MAGIAFFDLKTANLEIQDELEAAVLRVVRSGWFIGGGEVTAFEENFSRYTGAAHTVGTGNGMDALIIALLSLGIGAGDEVIVPAHTFIATWLAVTRVGAVPVPVAVDEATYVMDVEAFEAAITPKTKAVIPVHLYGHPAAMDRIMPIARQHGLKVIEDAAQSQGAEVGGRRIGGFGDVTCWSFYPAKNLGALGDAGGMTTQDAALAVKLRKMGNYGSEKKYVHAYADCLNSRLDPIQAAVLDVKLKHLDRWNEKRITVADFYNHELAGLPLVLPQTTEGVRHVWHMYVVRTQQRDALQVFLQERGIPTQIHYPIANHEQEAYAAMFAGRGGEEVFKQARQLADEVLSLPFGPHHTMAELATVVAAVKAFFAQA